VLHKESRVTNCDQNQVEKEEEKYGCCARCGRGPDPDLRTLWMACFYAMDELNVPFEEVALRGQYCEQTGTEPNPIVGEIKVFAEMDPEVENRLYRFYTLRVCKDCRGQWMGAIQAWFNEGLRERVSPGSGIFIREHGATIEISEEEWYRRNPGREPVRFLGDPDEDDSERLGMERQ
jgi:hypothetical protein